MFNSEPVCIVGLRASYCWYPSVMGFAAEARVVSASGEVGSDVGYCGLRQRSRLGGYRSGRSPSRLAALPHQTPGCNAIRGPAFRAVSGAGAAIATGSTLGGRPGRCFATGGASGLLRLLQSFNEQAFLKKRKRISPGTWENWQEGIQQNFRRPAFARAWAEVRGRAPESFNDLCDVPGIPRTDYQQLTDRSGAPVPALQADERLARSAPSPVRR